jgi:hypothetical protein
MQWTREGAHNVWQIRASMVSQEWEEKWLELVLPQIQEEKAASGLSLPILNIYASFSTSAIASALL